ncbi:hypothetical protein M758_2G095000 [Ceratodon purpureus]|nr:hypothetical protein M758_2G095000 [Ceratodon purpureus]
MPRLALAHGLLLCKLPFWVACLACAAMHFQTTEGFFSCEFRWRSWGVSQVINLDNVNSIMRSLFVLFSPSLSLEGPLLNIESR